MTGQPSLLTLNRARLLNTVGFKWKATPDCSNEIPLKGDTTTAARNGEITKKELVFTKQTHTSTLSPTIFEACPNDVLSLTAACYPGLRASLSAAKQSVGSPVMIEKLI